ncbi:hypothetical protein [Streptosporangium sp. NPDC049078]
MDIALVFLILATGGLAVRHYTRQHRGNSDAPGRDEDVYRPV